VATFSRVQIEVMARAAGWGARSKDVSWVAMAESSGDARQVNSIQCVGLLQINQPVFIDQHPSWTIEYLQDPMNNLRVGLTIFQQAGNQFDGPWADSKTKGGIPGGWGPHVTGGSTGTGTGSSGGDAAQVADDPCKYIKGPAHKHCVGSLPDPGTYPDPSGGGIWDTAAEIGRLAQTVAKAGNWLADPANWVRIAYVVGGGILAVTAIDVIIRPAVSGASGQLGRTVTGTATKSLLARRRANVTASRDAAKAAASEE
jgi:hypothetical protein